ncbi:hypothetical protein C4K37_3789 [Pseudomonas chlororaphis subsp. piscium]|nr:hypothetical protein C4K37_3789 [Pseudomonas chlororaphis subsp. piscium]AZC44720.1 hypothetical protein C4K36_3797 [Pseudomonas chlororaphis subsp. piscium]
MFSFCAPFKKSSFGDGVLWLFLFWFKKVRGCIFRLSDLVFHLLSVVSKKIAVSFFLYF